MIGRRGFFRLLMERATTIMGRIENVRWIATSPSLNCPCSACSLQSTALGPAWHEPA